VAVDFEGIRRSFRTLIDDSTLLFVARELQTSRAELLLGSLQVVGILTQIHEGCQA
jgi:hypothetical protein